MVFFRAFDSNEEISTSIPNEFHYYDVDIRRVGSGLVIDIEARLEKNDLNKTFYFNEKKVTHRVHAMKNTTIDLSKEKELDQCLSLYNHKDFSSPKLEILQDLCWKQHHKDN